MLETAGRVGRSAPKECILVEVTVKNIILSYLMLSLLILPKHSYAADSKKLQVMCTLFPLYDFARAIGQDRVEVKLLLPPGAEAHSFDPKPRDIAYIQKADVFIYTGEAMEPWVNEIVQSIKSPTLAIVDTSYDINYYQANGSRDPHVWLDFDNAQKMVDTIAAGFIRKDSAHKNFYITNAAAYKKELKALDKEFRQATSRCNKKIIIHAGHFAFGYLARRYGLMYIAAYQGTSSDKEPQPKDLVELIKKIKQYNVKYIFYEELAHPRVARSLAEETGGEMLKLSAAHNLSKDEFAQGVTFLSVMSQNLLNLKKGLECQLQ